MTTLLDHIGQPTGRIMEWIDHLNRIDCGPWPDDLGKRPRFWPHSLRTAGVLKRAAFKLIEREMREDAEFAMDLAALQALSAFCAE